MPTVEGSGEGTVVDPVVGAGEVGDGAAVVATVLLAAL